MVVCSTQARNKWAYLWVKLGTSGTKASLVCIEYGALSCSAKNLANAPHKTMASTVPHMDLSGGSSSLKRVKYIQVPYFMSELMMCIQVTRKTGLT